MTRQPQYFNLNKILLLTIGLWPYQQSKLTRLQFIFFSSILTTHIIFQFTTLMTLKCTLDLITKVLSSVSFFAVFAIKYNTFCVNIKAIKDLLIQLQHVCNGLKDKKEIAIIEEYGYNAKCYTTALTILAFCSLIGFTAIQCSSNILDVVLPINISRSRYLPVVTEYFIDQEKYFYLIFLHLNVAFYIGIITMVGIGSMLIAYLQHTCGMFRIASYRIEHAMNIKILQNISLKNKILISENLICAVHIHRLAIKLSAQLLSRIQSMMLFLIVFGVTSVSLNLFRIASSKDNGKELILPSYCAAIGILYMFLSNYIGQNIMDHNNYVYATAYNVQWYVAPLHIQRLILFLLQRSAKEFCLNVGGLFVASIQCFATLVKTSVSYFTVIYSTL